MNTLPVLFLAFLSGTAMAAENTAAPGPASATIDFTMQVASSVTLTITGTSNTTHAAADTAHNFGTTYYGQSGAIGGGLGTTYNNLDPGVLREYVIAELDCAVDVTGSYTQAQLAHELTASSFQVGVDGVIAVTGFDWGGHGPLSPPSTLGVLTNIGAPVADGSSLVLETGFRYNDTASGINTMQVTYSATGA